MCRNEGVASLNIASNARFSAPASSKSQVRLHSALCLRSSLWYDHVFLVAESLPRPPFGRLQSGGNSFPQPLPFRPTDENGRQIFAQTNKPRISSIPSISTLSKSGKVVGPVGSLTSLIFFRNLRTLRALLSDALPFSTTTRP